MNDSNNKIHSLSGIYENDSLEHKRISKFRNVTSQCFAVLAFNIIKFSAGNFVGFSSLMLAKLGNNDGLEIPISQEKLSWYASYCFTGPVGAILIGLLANRIGSKITFQLGSVLFCCLWIGYYYAKTANVLLIIQAIVGMNISIVLGPGVAYVVEVTQSNLRSTFMATTNLSMISGTFFTVLLSNWITNWRTIALVNLVFSIIGMMTIFFVPESPHWLASKGRYNEAERSLAWLRGWASPVDVKSEFYLLEKLHKKSESSSSSSSRIKKGRNFLKPYMQSNFFLPLIAITLLFMTHSLVGSHTISAFSMRLFKMMKAPLNEHLAGSIFSGLRIAGAVTCMLTVHLFGRRKLLFFSLSMGSLFYLILAIFLYAMKNNDYLNQFKIYSYVPPIMIMMSTFVFSSGMDKIVNMLNGELFPGKFRNVGSGIGSCLGAIFSMIFLKYFLTMIEYMTLQGVFLFFSIMSVFSFVLLYYVIPETEGITLMEIEEHYAQARGLTDRVIKKKNNL